MKQQNIFFIGAMATGKTTVGRHLAEALGRVFFDSDEVIESRAGVPIAWIFDQEGESGFRMREETVIEELTGQSEIVLATGGGAIMRPANRRALGARGCVVHLDCPLETMLERTEADRERPLLQGQDRRAVMEKLLRARLPLYRQLADYRFESGCGARRLAARIEQQLRLDKVIR